MKLSLYIGLGATAVAFPTARDNNDCKSPAVTSRIIGGTETQARSFPWMVSLQDKGQHFCGGTIIANRWVLTAAHCVEGEKASKVTIKAGVHKLSNAQQDKCVEVLPVKRIVMHPKYNSKTNANDIALLELGQASTYPPVALSASVDEAEGTSLMAIGWGQTSDNAGGASDSSGSEEWVGRGSGSSSVDWHGSEDWFGGSGSSDGHGSEDWFGGSDSGDSISFDWQSGSHDSLGDDHSGSSEGTHWFGGWESFGEGFNEDNHWFGGWEFVGEDSGSSEGVGPDTQKVAKGPADALLKVTVRALSNENCQELYDTNEGGTKITNGMICAGVPEGDKDTCYGDSGGPLFLSQQGKYTQVGVTSFGGKRCASATPGVYARVSHYLADFVCPVASVGC